MIRFATRYPVLFTILLVGILYAGQLIWLALLSGTDPLVWGLPGKVTICLIYALMLTQMRWWRDAGFGQPLSWHALREYLPTTLILVPPALLLISAGTTLDAAHVVGYAAMGLMIGFSEEAAFRGLALRAFMPSGPLRAAVLTSLIFGVGHSINLVVGQPLDNTVIQMITATMIAFVWCTARLASGSILPAIVIHSLVNFLTSVALGSLVVGTPPPAWHGLSVILILIALVVYSMWRIRRLETQSAVFGHEMQRSGA